jgi:hypothetical protein
MLTFYTTFGLKPWMAAATRGPVIFIHPRFKGDKGILEHEKVHRFQWFITLGLHPILYLLVPIYRLWAEVEAYKKQLKYCTEDRTEEFANDIAIFYDLRISKENALKLLKA